MLVPMALLAILSIGGGMLGAHAAGEPLQRFLSTTLGVHEAAPAAQPPAALLLAISVAVALGGIMTGWLAHRGRRDPHLGVPGVFLEQRWYIDALYDAVIVRPGRTLGLWLAGPVDLGLIDGIVNRVGWILGAAGGRIRVLQTGYARQYALALLVGTVLILGLWMLR
jgi:NADH-quinone oxidoreductase subunit L